MATRMPSLHLWVCDADSLSNHEFLYGKLIGYTTGPRTRAPLGAKTTNAKAKAFQTPLPTLLSNDSDKQTQKSATARKIKPRVSHAEMTKLEVLGDSEILGSKDDLEERDIEYMPPPVKSKDANHRFWRTS